MLMCKCLAGLGKGMYIRCLPVVIEESSLAQDVHAVYEMEHIHLLRWKQTAVSGDF